MRNGCVFIVEGQTFPIAIWPKPRSMPNSDRCFRHNNDKGFDLRAHFEVKAFSNGPMVCPGYPFSLVWPVA